MEALKRSVIVDDFGWKSVNKICGRNECLIPKLERHGSVSKE